MEFRRNFFTSYANIIQKLASLELPVTLHTAYAWNMAQRNIMASYDLKSLNLPKLYGKALSLFTNAVESPVLQPLLLGSLLENGGIPKLRKTVLDEAPTILDD